VIDNSASSEPLQGPGTHPDRQSVRVPAVADATNPWEEIATNPWEEITVRILVSNEADDEVGVQLQSKLEGVEVVTYDPNEPLPPENRMPTCSSPVSEQPPPDPAVETASATPHCAATLGRRMGSRVLIVGAAAPARPSRND
jgi:hypothetical protein